MFNKYGEYLRYLLIIIAIYFLSKKVLELDNRVYVVERKLSHDDIIAEYTTENDFEVCSTDIKNQVNKIKNEIIMEQRQETAEKQEEKVQPIFVENQIVVSEKEIDNASQEALTVAYTESKPMLRMDLKSLQELALSKGIEIKQSGKNKTKKQLQRELNNLL